MDTVAVVGLGYVGLPLAVEFGKTGPTLAFDHNGSRLAELARGSDPHRSVTDAELAAARHLRLCPDPAALVEADFILVAVPTPVDRAHRPNLGPLREASRTVGRHLKHGATVVFESTVYPGATEEECVPEIERASGKHWRRDFHVGYSPERINPGDREHTLVNTIKVVAGDSPATLARVTALYRRVITAAIHPASSIRVAEAAKVIENTQRDLNIALMNELALIFNRLGIDTTEVLEAAGTKWNFLPFRPGLVGGHCIGVDPYYLTYRAEAAGYIPQVILAGRRINDEMGKYVAEQTIKQMIRAGSHVKGARVNLLGVTFKEDFPDLRNSRVLELLQELRLYDIDVRVHDPVALPEEVQAEFGVKLASWDELPPAEALIVAVAHREFLARPIDGYLAKLVPGGCFIDVKARFDPAALRAARRAVWRL